MDRDDFKRQKAGLEKLLARRKRERAFLDAEIAALEKSIAALVTVEETPRFDPRGRKRKEEPPPNKNKRHD